MVLNYIWIAFFVIAFVVAVCKLLFFGDTQIFTEIINSTFDSSKTAFEISLGLIIAWARIRTSRRGRLSEILSNFLIFYTKTPPAPRRKSSEAAALCWLMQRRRRNRFWSLIYK